LVDGDGHLVFQAEQSGDISFYEDTGTTPKFQWSAGNERLVLKTSGAYALDVQASGNSSATIARFSNSNASDKLAIRLDANGDGELVLIDAGNNEDVVITAGGDTLGLIALATCWWGKRLQTLVQMVLKQPLAALQELQEHPLLLT
jgi:hypothetical protein